MEPVPPALAGVFLTLDHQGSAQGILLKHQPWWFLPTPHPRDFKHSGAPYSVRLQLLRLAVNTELPARDCPHC